MQVEKEAALEKERLVAEAEKAKKEALEDAKREREKEEEKKL